MRFFGELVYNKANWRMSSKILSMKLNFFVFNFQTLTKKTSGLKDQILQEKPLDKFNIQRTQQQLKVSNIGKLSHSIHFFSFWLSVFIRSYIVSLFSRSVIKISCVIITIKICIYIRTPLLPTYDNHNICTQKALKKHRQSYQYANTCSTKQCHLSKIWKE